MKAWVVIKNISENEEQNLYESESLADAQNFLREIKKRHGLTGVLNREEQGRFFISYEDAN